MLAYATDDRGAARRSHSPTALALILAGHAALIAAVLSARMDLRIADYLPNPDVYDVPVAPPPEPEVPPQPQPDRPAPQDSFIEQPHKLVDMGPRLPSLPLDNDPVFRDVVPSPGSGAATLPDPPRHVPVKLAARFATPADALKPPYPNDKLRAEEEATLRLRLTIDARGRVTAVEPVGAADPSFLAAARRHILRAWRYKPATEDGVAVTSSTVITLSFRLEDA